MSKGTLSAVIVLLVIIVGGLVWYFGFYASDDATNTNTTANTNSVVENANTLPVKQTESPILIFTLTPNSGKIAGGESVTITGANFVEGLDVYFGDNVSTSVTYVSEKEITVTVPSATTEGLVDVKIQNPDRISGVLQDGYTYTDTDTSATEE